jgi:hypothetical protein
MRRLRERVRELLVGGTSPEKLALTIALGATLGTLPVLGATTLLCAAVAVWLRLNMPLLQLVNYLVYPLHLAAYIPLLAAGARWMDPRREGLTMAAVWARIEANLWGAVTELFWANVGAVTLWALAAAPLGYLLYRTVLVAVRNLHRKLQTPA